MNFPSTFLRNHFLPPTLSLSLSQFFYFGQAISIRKPCDDKCCCAGRRATCDVTPGSKNNIQLVEDQANPDIVG